MRTQSAAEKMHYDARVDALLDEMARLRDLLTQAEVENALLRMLVPGSEEIASIVFNTGPRGIL